MTAQHFFLRLFTNLRRRTASPATPNPLIDHARRSCPNRDSCPLRRSPPHPVPCPHASLRRMLTVVPAKAATSHPRSPAPRLRPGWNEMEPNGTKLKVLLLLITPDSRARRQPRPHEANKAMPSPHRTSGRRAKRGHGGLIFSPAARSKRGQPRPNGSRIQPSAPDALLKQPRARGGTATENEQTFDTSGAPRYVPAINPPVSRLRHRLSGKP